MTDMALEPHTAPDGQTPVPGITYLYYDGPTLWPFGWGLSYTTFSYAWFDGESAHQTVDAAEWASGAAQPPSYAVNVTNTGNVASDVSALAFYSTGLPGEPIQELFDFARAAAVHPGETVTLFFTLPPAVAATVSADGTQALTPGRFTVRIGDVSDTARADAPTSAVWGSVDITGPAPVVLSPAPRLRVDF